MKANVSLIMVLLACTALVFVGCGSSGSEVDETKPISEVKAEAETMSVEQLKDIAMAYKEALEANKSEVKKLMEQLSNIPVAQQLGEEFKSLQTDIAQLNDSYKALKERFDVYYNKLVELKADVTNLKL
jgi:chromosome segregation ATPase